MRHARWAELWALGLISTASIPLGGIPVAAADCSNPSRLEPQERTLCTLNGSDGGGSVRTIDAGTGLQVTELTTDLDWKNANRASIPGRRW